MLLIVWVGKWDGEANRSIIASAAGERVKGLALIASGDRMLLGYYAVAMKWKKLIRFDSICTAGSEPLIWEGGTQRWHEKKEYENYVSRWTWARFMKKIPHLSSLKLEIGDIIQGFPQKTC